MSEASNLGIGSRVRHHQFGDGVITNVKSETYKVKKGDTLMKIAKKFDTTVSALKQKNSLKSDALSIDQKLLIH